MSRRVEWPMHYCVLHNLAALLCYKVKQRVYGRWWWPVHCTAVARVQESLRPQHSPSSFFKLDWRQMGGPSSFELDLRDKY